MKVYKLIKTYPGSPKLGTLEEVISDNTHLMINGRYGYDFDKNPEFWELQKQKEYEILKLQNRGATDCFFIPDINNTFRWQSWYKSISGCSLDNILKAGNIVYSVKRLSDNEIFTKNDKVEVSGKTGYISEFRLVNDILVVVILYNNNLHGVQVRINKLKKLEKLFTTEDGVDIYKNDVFSYINHLNSIFFDVMAYENTKIKNDMKAFSTKKAAIEWINNTKPILSLNDIKKIKIEYTTNIESYISLDKLMKLIEEKLGNML